MTRTKSGPVAMPLHLSIAAWPVAMPLHLRIVAAAWHDDQMRSGSATRLDIGEIKTVLVPRHWQALLHKLDPSRELTVPSVRTRLEPLVRHYEKLILHDKVESGMTLNLLEG